MTNLSALTNNTNTIINVTTEEWGEHTIDLGPDYMEYVACYDGVKEETVPVGRRTEIRNMDGSTVNQVNDMFIVNEGTYQLCRVNYDVRTQSIYIGDSFGGGYEDIDTAIEEIEVIDIIEVMED